MKLEDLDLERELIESSSEVSSVFLGFSSSRLRAEESNMGWPFRADSHLRGWVEEEELAVMNREPRGRACLDHRDLSSGLRVFDLLIMTSIGTGYDLSASTYSPDGRIFQVNIAAGSSVLPFLTMITFKVEYANKAVDNSGYGAL